MNIKGKVTHVCPERKGTSERTGSEWRSQEAVVSYYENPTDRYPDSIVVSIRNEKIDELKLAVGDEVEIGFGLSAREYQGRYFQEVRTFRLSKVEGTAQPAGETAGTAAVVAPATPAASPTVEPAGVVKDQGEGDLPF